MKNIYRNIKDYSFGEHTAAFEVLIEKFNEINLTYFLIGAQARDVHFFQKGIKPLRATRDIDFAVMVDSMEHYLAVREYLTSHGFIETNEPYRLIWDRGKTIIDLLPYGQIEENYTVNFDKRTIELSVLGYQELNDEVGLYYIDENQSLSIPVPPLHGIFLLKLLSWNEKKAVREKDLYDLNQILANYWEFVEEEAYDKHLDIFDDNNFEIGKAAARILGRHLKATLSKSEFLKTEILKILNEQTQSIDSPGQLLQKFARDMKKSLKEVQELLEEILKGINN